MSNPKRRPEAADASRFQELDVLRGLAAVAVLLFHYLTRYDQKYTPRGDVPFGFADGAYGVHLFFVISGFVIFMTLSRCATASDFLVSRLSRLYPAYWAAALLTCAVGTLWPLPGQHYTLMQLLTNLTMLQGFGQVAPIDGVYWTLNIELCFYAVMLALFASGMLSSTVRLSVVWLAAAAAAHLLSASGSGFVVPETIQQVFVLRYAALFVAGINFYEIYQKGPSVIRAALILSCLSVHWIDYGAASTERILVVFGLVAIAVSGRVRFLCVRPLVWLGTISYSLYLTHQMIGFAAIKALSGDRLPSVVAIPATMILAITVASAMTYLVERPAMRVIRSRRKAQRAMVGSPL
jgi:peptidoglycan/LPS O-acetylase OafA/YrhL